MPSPTARKAKESINAPHPGIVKIGIIRGHEDFITGHQAETGVTERTDESQKEMVSSVRNNKRASPELVEDGGSKGGLDTKHHCEIAPARK
ncbi:unnamed protein product [Ilex paraguariensis]|uniref:Uncharacterized protein n=1 Tax=Ilex paraguariensis TaxID=185542 RepID=A0ABC8R168_9AQUA